MNNNECIFCNVTNSDDFEYIGENRNSVSFWDNFPVSQGHALIIPKRHIESFFELDQKEIDSIYDLMKITREIIVKKYNPPAFNIGINDGLEAGRTIHHLHIHLIPRYKGDVDDPKGGVRHIIPGKGFY